MNGVNKKGTLAGIHSRLDIAEKKIGELEDLAMETIQKGTQKEEKKETKLKEK